MSNEVNPNFRAEDGLHGRGMTAPIRKAIAEQQKGKTSVLFLPVHEFINILLEAGAELRPLGRVASLTRNQAAQSEPTPCLRVHLARQPAQTPEPV